MVTTRGERARSANNLDVPAHPLHAQTSALRTVPASAPSPPRSLAPKKTFTTPDRPVAGRGNHGVSYSCLLFARRRVTKMPRRWLQASQPSSASRGGFHSYSLTVEEIRPQNLREHLPEMRDCFPGTVGYAGSGIRRGTPAGWWKLSTCSSGSLKSAVSPPSGASLTGTTISTL